MSIQDLYRQFPDVHPNIILKADILRLGIDISKAASENFKGRNDLLWKGFHLFSYDFKKTALYSENVPWLMHLEDGCNIQVRTNDETPYKIDLVDSEFVIKEGDEIIARNIWFERKPRFYDMKTKEGTQLGAIAQGHSRFLFVTINKYCELKNTGDECLFCDFNATTKDQATGGEDLLARGDAEIIAEAVQTAFEADHHMAWLWISGGTIISKFRGETELDFYCSRLNTIRERLQVWPPSVFQVRAQTDEGWRRIHGTGVSTVQPNIEVWGKDLFAWICPGKHKYIGWDEWIRSTIKAVDFWGRGRVNPNFVLGVEMARPYGFTDVKSAVKSTAAGFDFLMEHGVLPRLATWIIESGSAFGKQGQPIPPLEYFIEAYKAYTELRWKHHFDPPWPGGNTFFSMAHNCLCDFEYYHGTGPLSKSYLDTRLGVKPGEKGGHFDQEGYILPGK